MLAAEQDPFVAAPPGARVFECRLSVGLGDTTPSGRARLDALARWLQDAAYLDVADAGLEDRGAWVVRRLRIRAERFPRFGEALRMRTWCSAAAALAAERRTTIEGSEGRVEAVATWVFLNADSGRPQRLGPEFEAVYGTGAAGRRAHTRLRHGPPPAGAGRLGWRFRVADLDVAEHVNNAAYWQIAEELMAAAQPESLDAEIEFRDPALGGEAVVRRAGGSLWIESPGGKLNATIAGLPLS